MKKDKAKGITLIALVITVIILLILEGITMISLTGDNGILTKASNTKKEANKAEAREDIALAIRNLEIVEDEKETMSQEEKRQELERELKKIKSTSEVISKESFSKEGKTKFLVKHKGYFFDIDENYEIIINQKNDSNEWNQLAVPEDCFYWGSDIEGEEGYNTIIGWKKEIDNYTILRIPSRCQEIECDEVLDEVWRETIGNYRGYTSNIKEIQLPETITKIGNNAFGGGYYQSCIAFQSVKKINIPEGVTSIGNYAFSGCSELTDIIIPNSVASIGNDAFSYCTSLTDITLSNRLTEIKKYTFSNCRKLMNVKIPNGVASIGCSAFERCSKLKNITIPENVTSIDSYAFYSCDELTSITVPNSVTSIGDSAFGGCSNLKNINIKKPKDSISGAPWKGSWNTSNTTVNWDYQGD